MLTLCRKRCILFRRSTRGHHKPVRGMKKVLIGRKKCLTGWRKRAKLIELQPRNRLKHIGICLKKEIKKFLTNLWKWCKMNKLLDWVAKNIVPCKLNNVTWTNYKPEILLKFILRKRTGRCKTGIKITASQHIAEIFDYNELCS